MSAQQYYNFIIKEKVSQCLVHWAFIRAYPRLSPTTHGETFTDLLFQDWTPLLKGYFKSVQPPPQPNASLYDNMPIFLYCDSFNIAMSVHKARYSISHKLWTKSNLDGLSRKLVCELLTYSIREPAGTKILSIYIK